MTISFYWSVIRFDRLQISIISSKIKRQKYFSHRVKSFYLFTVNVGLSQPKHLCAECNKSHSNEAYKEQLRLGWHDYSMSEWLHKYSLYDVWLENHLKSGSCKFRHLLEVSAS